MYMILGERLKKCPFCNRDKAYVMRDSGDFGEEYVCVTCKACGAHTRHYAYASYDVFAVENECFNLHNFKDCIKYSVNDWNKQYNLTKEEKIDRTWDDFKVGCLTEL